MSRGRRVEYRGSGLYVSFVLIILIGALILFFALQNTEPVSVSLFGAQFDTPLFGVAIGAGLVALVLGELVGLVWRRQRRRRLTERRELDDLRTAVGQEPDSVEVPAGEHASVTIPPPSESL
jgi:uncharacterized integral membrane protein